MRSAQMDVLLADATVRELIRPLVDCLEGQPGATEICVNRPGEVIVGVAPEWKRFEAPALTLEWALSLAPHIVTFIGHSHRWVPGRGDSYGYAQVQPQAGSKEKPREAGHAVA